MSAKEEFLKQLADKNADLTPIFEEAFKRYEEGKEKYGTFNAVMDQRNLGEEIINEYLDIINYSAMRILQIRRRGL